MTDTYVARPYNFSVSPLFIEGDRLKINRDITFSTKNVQFLMDNSFNMGAIFTKGVPYLSREEEATTRQIFIKSQDRSTQIPDLFISPSDGEALGFYHMVRKTVSAFAKQKEVCKNFILISGHPLFLRPSKENYPDTLRIRRFVML
jgi:poly(A)-specific ribonuclease